MPEEIFTWEQWKKGERCSRCSGCSGVGCLFFDHTEESQQELFETARRIGESIARRREEKFLEQLRSPRPPRSKPSS